MIKKSGENVDAPEEIHPEQIKRLLEEQPVDKKSRFRRYASGEQLRQSSHWRSSEG